jgi:hypothetical protein
MKKSKIIYPDLSELHARKEQGRREAARRTLGEKIAIVEAMRERLAPLKLAREARASRAASDAGDMASREETP